MPADIDLIVGAQTKLADEAIAKLVARPRNLNLRLNDNVSGSLGRIRAQLGEFDKSLAASNARVLAFGASAGAMYAVGRSIKELVKSTVEVEKKLVSINSILGASRSEFSRFGNELFRIAQETSSSFGEVADAAEELARQGAGTEETLKRTSSVMKLVRISGISAASAVEAMTAALNSNNDVLLTAESLTNKLAAVDAKFAVSAAGLTEALKRVGSVAADAGFSIDDLIAAVTSAQQTTARGEAVIGNSLKTIFTRAQRPKVLEDFESLGIATKNAAGNIRPLKEVLIEVAKQYDNLSSAQQSSISELVGGVYQINILKALFKDLGKETSIFGQAFSTSFESSGEANKRIAELNETLDALFKRFSTNLTKFGSQAGNNAFAPLGKNLLKGMNTALEAVSSEADAKDTFSGKLFEGIFKGIGAALSGPALVGGLAVFIRLIRDMGRQGKDALMTLSGLNSSFHNLQLVTSSVSQFLQEHPRHLQAITAASRTAAGATREIAAATADYNEHLARQVGLRNATNMASNAVALQVVKKGGYVAPDSFGREVLNQRRASGGLMPEMAERIGAYAGGYTPGAVQQMNVPGMGKVYYNSAEKVKQFPGMSQPAIIPPLNSRAGHNYQKEFRERHGFNPYAAEGMIPNFTTSQSPFNKQILSSFSKERELIKYINSLGISAQKGSSRLFVPISEKAGIKIAMNPAGIAQNEVEFPILNSDYFAKQQYSDILPKGYGFDENNFRFGFVERLAKPNAEDFRKVTRKSKSSFLNDKTKLSSTEEQIKEFLANYGLSDREFMGGANTGVDKQGKLKLLDVGFNDDVKNRFYWKNGKRDLGQFNNGLIPNFAPNPALQRAFTERFYRAKRGLQPEEGLKTTTSPEFVGNPPSFEDLTRKGVDLSKFGELFPYKQVVQTRFHGLSTIPSSATTVSGSINAITNRAPDEVTKRQLLRLAREFDFGISGNGQKKQLSSNIFRDFFNVSGQANDEMTFAKTAKHLKFGIRDRQTYEYIDLDQLNKARQENINRFLAERAKKTSPYLFRGVSLDEITNLRRLGQVTSLGTANADEKLGTFITSSFGKAAGFGAATLKESGQGYVLALDKKRVMGRPIAESIFGSEEKNTIKAGRIEKDDVLGIVDLKTRQIRRLEEFAARNNEVTTSRKIKLSELRNLIDKRDYQPRVISESFIRESIISQNQGALKTAKYALASGSWSGRPMSEEHKRLLQLGLQDHEYAIEHAGALAWNQAKSSKKWNRKNLSAIVSKLQSSTPDFARLKSILSHSDSDILSTGRYSMAAGLVPNFSSLSSAFSRESQSVNSNLIRVGSHSELRGPGNPDGLGVYNLRDEPLGLGQGVQRAKSQGLNPKTHGIPNYASIVPFKKQGSAITEYIFGNENSPAREGALSKAFAASMVAPMVNSFAGTSESQGGKIASEISEAISLGLTVAAFARGKGGGKLAAGAGIISGLMGVIKQAKASFDGLDAEVQILKDKVQKAGDGMGMYGQTLEQLQSVYLDTSTSAEESTKKIVKLQNKLAETLSQLPDDLRQKLIGAKTLEQVQDVGAEYNRGKIAELQQKELTLGLSTNLNQRLPFFRSGSLLEMGKFETVGGKEQLKGVADALLSVLGTKGLEKAGGSAALQGDLFGSLQKGGISAGLIEQLKRIDPKEFAVIKQQLISRAGTQESDVAKMRNLAPQRQREIEQFAALEKRIKSIRDVLRQSFEAIGQTANLQLRVANREGLMRATGINERIQGISSLMGETSSPQQMAATSYRSQVASNQLKAASDTAEVFTDLRTKILDMFNQFDMSRTGEIPANMRKGQTRLLGALGGQSVGGIGESAISIFKSLGKDENVADIKKLMSDSNEKLVDIQQTLREGNKLAKIQKSLALQRAEFDRTLKTGGGLSSFLDRGDKYGKIGDIYSAQFGLQSGIFKGQGAIELLRSYMAAGGQAGDPGVSKLLGTAKEQRALDIIETQKDLNRAFEGSGLKLGVPSLAEARKQAETQIAAELKTGDSDMERQMAGLERALSGALNSSMGGQMNDAAQTFATVLSGSNTFQKLNGALEKNTQVLMGLDAALKAMKVGVTSEVISSTRAGGNIPISAAATEKMMAKAGGYNPGYVRRAGNLIYNSAERVSYLPGVREPVISPPPGSLAGFLHRQKYRNLGFAAKGNPYLFVPTTSLDEDQIKAIRKAGYNPLDVNAREAYRKGKLSIPRGSRVIDPTMAFTGGAEGWETPLSKSKARNLSILTGNDPGMTDKLMETKMMKGLPKSEDLTDVLKRHNISTKGKIDIAAHQAILEKEFGKGFFIKAKEGVQSRGVYSQNKLFDGFDSKEGTGLRSLEQNRPKLGTKRFFVQSAIPNTSDRVFRVSTLGTREGAKVLGKSQIRMARGTIESDAFGSLYDHEGKPVRGNDTLAHRTATGEITTNVSKKDLRENLLSRRIADAQARRAMKSLPANLRAGALAGMDVAETGYTGVMKRLQVLAEETGIGYQLFKGGGVIEPNFSDKLGYSGALQKSDLSVEVAKELESVEKSRASSPVASQNVASPVKKVQQRGANGRFIGKPKPIMGSQLNVGLNTAPVNSGIRIGQAGYSSPDVSGINFEGGSTPTGDYKPGISEQGYRPTSSVRTPSASQISNLRKVAAAKKYAMTGAKGLGVGLAAAGGALGAYELGKGIFGGYGEGAKSGNIGQVGMETYGQAIGAAALLQGAGAVGLATPALGAAGAAAGAFGATAGLVVAGGVAMGKTIGAAYDAKTAQKQEQQAYRDAGLSKEQVAKMKESGQLEKSHVWKGIEKGRAGTIKNMTYYPRALAQGAKNFYQGSGGLFDNAAIQHLFGGGNLDSPAEKAATDAYNPGKYYRDLRENQATSQEAAKRYSTQEAYKATSGTRFQQEQHKLLQGMSPADRVTYFKQQMTGKYGQWGTQEDYKAGLSRASMDQNRDMLAKRYNITAPGQLDRLQTGLAKATQEGKLQEYVSRLDKVFKGVTQQTQAAPVKPEVATGDKTKLDVNITMGGNLGVKNTNVEFSEEQYLVINAMIAEVTQGIEAKLKAIVEKLPADVRSNVANATPPQSIEPPGSV